MGKKDINKIKYTRLKKRSASSRSRNYNLRRVMGSVYSSLLPRREKKASEAPVTNNNEENIKNLQNSFNQQLASNKKEYSKAIRNLDKDNRTSISKLSDALKFSTDRNAMISGKLQEAIARVAKSKGQTGPTEPTKTANDSTTDSDAFMANITGAPTNKDILLAEAKKKEDKDKTTDVVETVVKKSLKIGQTVGVGEGFYRVTNIFGERSGDNAVSGIDSTEHSKGIDVVSYDNRGNPTNAPMAIADGIIVNVQMQGDGSAVHPSKGRSAGGFIDVATKKADGKIKVLRYMHLGKEIMDIASTLKGKAVKRGQNLYDLPEGLKRWSFAGSGSEIGLDGVMRPGSTGHLKIQAFDLDEQGNKIDDPTNPDNDPSQFLIN